MFVRNLFIYNTIRSLNAQVFDVLLNGQAVIRDLDIFAEADGLGKGLDKLVPLFCDQV